MKFILSLLLLLLLATTTIQTTIDIKIALEQLGSEFVCPEWKRTPVPKSSGSSNTSKAVEESVANVPLLALLKDKKYLAFISAAQKCAKQYTEKFATIKLQEGRIEEPKPAGKIWDEPSTIRNALSDADTLKRSFIDYTGTKVVEIVDSIKEIPQEHHILLKQRVLRAFLEYYVATYGSLNYIIFPFLAGYCEAQFTEQNDAQLKHGAKETLVEEFVRISGVGQADKYWVKVVGGCNDEQSSQGGLALTDERVTLELALLQSATMKYLKAKYDQSKTIPSISTIKTTPPSKLAIEDKKKFLRLLNKEQRPDLLYAYLALRADENGKPSFSRNNTQAPLEYDIIYDLKPESTLILGKEEFFDEPFDSLMVLFGDSDLPFHGSQKYLERVFKGFKHQFCKQLKDPERIFRFLLLLSIHKKQESSQKLRRFFIDQCKPYEEGFSGVLKSIDERFIDNDKKTPSNHGILKFIKDQSHFNLDDIKMAGESIKIKAILNQPTEEKLKSLNSDQVIFSKLQPEVLDLIQSWSLQRKNELKGIKNPPKSTGTPPTKEDTTPIDVNQVKKLAEEKAAKFRTETLKAISALFNQVDILKSGVGEQMFVQLAINLLEMEAEASFHGLCDFETPATSPAKADVPAGTAKTGIPPRPAIPARCMDLPLRIVKDYRQKVLTLMELKRMIKDEDPEAQGKRSAKENEIIQITSRYRTLFNNMNKYLREEFKVTLVQQNQNKPASEPASITDAINSRNKAGGGNASKGEPGLNDSVTIPKVINLDYTNCLELTKIGPMQDLRPAFSEWHGKNLLSNTSDEETLSHMLAYALRDQRLYQVYDILTHKSIKPTFSLTFGFRIFLLYLFNTIGIEKGVIEEAQKDKGYAINHLGFSTTKIDKCEAPPAAGGKAIGGGGIGSKAAQPNQSTPASPPAPSKAEEWEALAKKEACDLNDPVALPTLSTEYIWCENILLVGCKKTNAPFFRRKESSNFTFEAQPTPSNIPPPKLESPRDGYPEYWLMNTIEMLQKEFDLTPKKERPTFGKQVRSSMAVYIRLLINYMGFTIDEDTRPLIDYLNYKTFEMSQD